MQACILFNRYQLSLKRAFVDMRLLRGTSSECVSGGNIAYSHVYVRVYVMLIILVISQAQSMHVYCSIQKETLRVKISWGLLKVIFHGLLIGRPIEFFNLIKFMKI